ncbi:MAG: UDP-N-acetylmuramoyl-tripeptide--D-alanyl-D-alanine ligase [Coriobacteriia bacterium]|nr:UDP-N-acetylmuramoyl-tripeptide--D-alanyl-D-alanine ligase [Coriobacteriia bacterium]
MKLKLSQILSISGIEPIDGVNNPEQVITSLEWDSRKVRAGSAFLAMQGEHVDGNEYLFSALAAGAVLLIASRPVGALLMDAAAEHNATLVQVSDPEWILGEIAKIWRDQLSARVVGVTGSSGKTSTKELIASVLQQKFRTEKNQGNFNNLLGLPYTVLQAAEDTELLVLEMGMQYKGEISRYTQISRPEIAVFTNIGVAHIELLGSQQAIAEAKAELIEALPDNNGLVVINGDDPFTETMLQIGKADQRGLEVIRYGLSDSNDVYASDISYDQQGRPSFTIRFPGFEAIAVTMQLTGEHNIKNALAAAALAHRLGIDSSDIITGLMQAEAPSQRQEIIELHGSLIINDSYNANPDSMRASLKTLALTEPDRPHIAVLGDMFELGEHEEELHREIGSFVAEQDLSLLLTVGRRAAWIADAASQALAHSSGSTAFASTSPKLCIISVDEWQDAVQLLLPELERQAVILVKASRSMALERIVDALSESQSSQGGTA